MRTQNDWTDPPKKHLSSGVRVSTICMNCQLNLQGHRMNKAEACDAFSEHPTAQSIQREIEKRMAAALAPKEAAKDAASGLPDDQN